MKKALIVGSDGQDGRLLFDELTNAGYGVAGLGRESLRTENCSAPPTPSLFSPKGMEDWINVFSPDEIYYLAAYHHSSEDRLPEAGALLEDSWKTHVHGFVNILEAVSRCSPSARTFYASSRLIFGDAVGFLDESTPVRPHCIYGITKAAGTQLCEYYRRTHRLFVSAGILFNHESSLRGKGFLSRKIITGVASICRGEAEEIVIGNLDASADWGYAPDFVEAMRRVIDTDVAGDFVIGTGELHSVRHFVETACEVAGLNWRSAVREAPGQLMRTMTAAAANSERLRRATGWRPSVDFKQMVRILMEQELRQNAV